MKTKLKVAIDKLATATKIVSATLANAVVDEFTTEDCEALAELTKRSCALNKAAALALASFSGRELAERLLKDARAAVDAPPSTPKDASGS